MHPILEQVINQERGTYDDLPMVLQQYYTPREWAFLTDAQKADVMRDACEPEA
jgi:hypothetical protein